MKKDLEKIYENYFPLEHQNCGDECSKKSAEIQMREDFVKDIKHLFCSELWENFEYHGKDYVAEQSNRDLQEIIDWISES